MIKAVSAKLRSTQSPDQDPEVVEIVVDGPRGQASPQKPKPPLQVRLNKLDIIESRPLFIRELHDVLDFWACASNSVRHKADLAVRLAALYWDVSMDKTTRNELLAFRGEEAQVVLETLIWVGYLHLEKPLVLTMVGRPSIPGRQEKKKPRF
jgi:hypothetical protein